MPRSFDMAADYDGTVAQIHEAFADENYWLARLAESGADEATLDSIAADADGGLDVVTTQIMRADRLPAVVGQFHHGDLKIVREEAWTPVRDGRATATVKGTIPGAPATLSGTAELFGTDTGSRLAFHATVEVRIPLVGGKVENFVGAQLVGLLTAEQNFTTAWIKAHA
ncbi:DUF2505 domain-containing protein [Mycobacterium yunnanensis]|uniref:DUF2505 domain-containing protein n=1 Tax=Mycobacterium yunnanensis TaxID=368477 RepID=A0A9X2Z3A2_9MYCO|nr:DUF2505 domain-containing protein [Mycobacterium yunnanensis]MCV7421187.1 DUF2505 domain-containing protein [Mycobacterium yunnanensis]